VLVVLVKLISADIILGQTVIPRDYEYIYFKIRKLNEILITEYDVVNACFFLVFLCIFLIVK